MTMIKILTQLRAAITAGDREKMDELLTAAMQHTALVPEISIYLEGGLVQEVYRANDAPFTLHIHDEDVEGTSNNICEVRHDDGSVSEAIISTYDHTDGVFETDEAYWESLRNPVVIDEAPEDEDS